MNSIEIKRHKKKNIIDDLEGISLQDLALAKAFNMDVDDCKQLSLFQQRRKLQNYAFSLEEKNEKISKEEANELNDIMYRLTMALEYNYGVDFSADYIIDFDRYVEGNEDMPKTY
ncbi:hypothetical protein [Clostridium perfringens]|uniref:Uncharacterized protein n=1 Tax=Clostridium perfringens TaxID=1502 RepID=A0A140GRE8_CLOPF|nr:hypothetical protein [Clostridium perfringens]AMN31107.1 hypothetical protein JFP838_pA0191 [Clostridium perfringens]